MFRTVAVILISDLFLQGKQENDLRSLLIEIKSANFLIKKISVLHQNEKIVTNELKILCKQFDIVIVVEKSSEIIFKAIANITGQKQTNNLKFKEILANLEESNTYQLPVGSKLLTGESDFVYPIIQIQTIFILKDEYMEKQLNILRERLVQYGFQAKYSKVLHIQMNGNTHQFLEKIKKLHINTVCQKTETVLSVILESTNFNEIIEIERIVHGEYKNNFINSSIVGNVLESIYNDRDDRIHQAIEVIEKCLKNYGPENTFLSFNGGKDCTVLLHLIRTVLNVKYPNWKNSIICLYVKSENAFPEQDKFISQCQIYFNLEVITVTQSIKEALKKILLLKPNLKACFMGTRRTDPFSSDLEIFQMTDRDWPQIMRVSPLLDWHYSDIWDYLLYYKVPYCQLYDMGFTSLGNALNTVRNPSLLYNDIYLEEEIYLPAYKMFNENKERSGRNI